MSKLAFNENDFNTKYDKYSKLLYRIAYQYLLDKEMSEDVVQEAFVKLFTNRKPFNGEDHEKAWLIRVAANLCKNRLTSAASNTVAFDTDVADAAPPFAQESEQKIDIEKELNKLSGEQRTCIYLFYYERYKIKEISETLNINENTVKSILSRARQTLKDNIEKEYDYEL